MLKNDTPLVCVYVHVSLGLDGYSVCITVYGIFEHVHVLMVLHLAVYMHACIIY